MTKDQVELIDQLIHANLKRLLAATMVAHNSDLQDERQVLAMMLPVEGEIERIKELLLKA
jgi:hypothetical protein